MPGFTLNDLITAASAAWGTRGRTGTAPAAAAAAWCGRHAAGPHVPGRTPTGPAGRPGTTGTPASRPPGQRPRHRHPGTAARRAGLPGRLGHEPSLPGTGRPGQGALVLQHAPPPPGPQPVSRTLPETGTMTTRHRARHARCQPRHEPGTLIATVTPATSTPRHRTPWTPPDDATPAPQGRGYHSRCVKELLRVILRRVRDTR